MTELRLDHLYSSKDSVSFKDLYTPSYTSESKIFSGVWGRSIAIDKVVLLQVVAVFFLTPIMLIFCIRSCKFYDCQLLNPILSGHFSIIDILIPAPFDVNALKIFFGWMAVQIFFFLYVPGTLSKGIVTPAGNQLLYNINGLRAFFLSHLLFFFCVYFNIISGTVVYDNWESLLTIGLFWGNGLAIFSYFKAIYFPTHIEDCKFTGSFFYDFILGVEFNPRIGNFDFKLFFNGRPGIIGWNLINISFLFAQYEMHGEVSNSLVLLFFLQMLYIVDFFWNEDWYLCTIDMAHDHFGWYLAWGDSVWLPFMYTLQGLYLVTHPYKMSTLQFTIVGLIGVVGYSIFRLANHQRITFRKSDPQNFKVWGKPARYIKVEYKTSDGKMHHTHLLTSGFWGMARHFNYFGDLCLSFAFCACCGFNHALPYFYFLYMLVLLVWRVSRDHHRLHLKYGPKWEIYCNTVPWKIVPYVF